MRTLVAKGKHTQDLKTTSDQSADDEVVQDGIDETRILEEYVAS
jgi:hypothetical protein